MHIFTIPEVLDLGLQGQFDPGSFLMEDRNAAEFMLGNPRVHGTMRPWENDRLSTDPKHILVIGTAGFGDCLLLTPVLRELKRRYPEAILSLSCFQEYRQVFIGLPYIDGYAPYPLPLGQLNGCDRVHTLEFAVQFNELAKAQHMTDRFASHFGITLSTKKPDYLVSSEELRWVQEKFPRTKRKRLAVQIQAGVRCRSYPGKLLSLVVTKLIHDGWEVYGMGRPGEFATTEMPYLRNIAQLGLSWRQSVAVLTTCDCFLGPDSSLLHAAGTLDIPAVGLFGPYPWKLRTAHYQSVFAIQGNEGCDLAPCFHVQWPGMPPFPLNGPCMGTGYCLPLAAITPERITRKIEQLASQQDERGAVVLPASKAGSDPELPDDTPPVAPVIAFDRTIPPAISIP